jgi:hypothetical protein
MPVNRSHVVSQFRDRCNEELTTIESISNDAISTNQIDDVVADNYKYFAEKLNFTLSDEERRFVVYELNQRDVHVVAPTTLRGNRVTRWMGDSPPDWKLWKDYENHLLRDKIARKVIWNNETVIDECIDLSGDPKRTGPWESRGLVMGNVQSGKTLNFIGLMNKAIDAGYHTVIVIGGHLKELREQTQERVDSGVMGRDSSKFGRGNNIAITSEPFGVGKSGLAGRPHHGTTFHNDFNATQTTALGVNYSLESPVVFVVKKNYKIINNLRDWIEAWQDKSVRNRPMMLIDDEADYASINTKKSGEVAAATNKSIKQLLNTFSRKTYIAYTATPFANVFIPQFQGTDSQFDDDLFPRDFMAAMPIPENYCGQDFFFPEDSSEEESGPVRNIPEDVYTKWLDIKHKKDAEVEGLPPSLKEAVQTFVLVISIRMMRGYTSAHNTMLVNVSRFNDVQRAVAEELDSYMTEVRNAVRSNGAFELERALTNPILKDLNDCFVHEFGSCEFEFVDVLQNLEKITQKVKVSLINGLFKKFAVDKKASPLPYADNKDEGLWVIAVGGLKLSRGLTLEGLSVSYFLRNAAAYDTLTQMCRWFGYRPRYEDLCRLWITSESEEHYYSAAKAIRQLYDDLKLMKAADRTPRDFGLRVLADEHTMLITARNKMGSAELVKTNYKLWGDTFKKLRSFADESKNIKNLNVIKNVVQDLLDKEAINIDKVSTKPYVLRDVSYDSLIKIVENTDYPEIHPRANVEPVSKALNALSAKGFKNPSIIIFNVGKSTHSKQELLSSEEYALASGDFDFCGFRVGLRNRTMQVKDGHIYSIKAQIGDNDDLKILFEGKEALKIGKFDSSVSMQTQHHNSIDSPVMVIYIFAAVITSKPKDDNKWAHLGHKHAPTINYSIFFPSKNIASNPTAQSVNVPEMDVEQSYYHNEVMQGINITNEIDEDQELYDLDGQL